MCQSNLFVHAENEIGLEEKERKWIRQPCVCCRDFELPTVKVKARRCHDPRLCIHLINKGDEDESSFEIVLSSREATFMTCYLNDFGRVLVGFQSDLKHLRKHGYNLCRNVDWRKHDGCEVGVKWTDDGDRIFYMYDISVDYRQQICLAPKHFLRLVCHVDRLLKLTNDHPQHMTKMLFSQLPFFCEAQLKLKQQQQHPGCDCITNPKEQMCICRKEWRNDALVANFHRCHDDRFCVHLRNDKSVDHVMLTSVFASRLVDFLPQFAKSLLSPAHNQKDYWFLDDIFQNKSVGATVYLYNHNGVIYFGISNGRFTDCVDLSPRQFFNFAAFLGGLLDLTNDPNY